MKLEGKTKRKEVCFKTPEEWAALMGIPIENIKNGIASLMKIGYMQKELRGKRYRFMRISF